MKIRKEAIFLIFYFLFSLVPFVAFQWNLDGYEFPKYLFIILFGLICGIIIFFSEKIFIPNKIFSLFVISFLISTIFSENFLYSFFGDYPRLNHNLIIIFSIILISIVYKTYLSNLDIFKIIFYQSIFLALITLFEENQRVFATFGQPNFLGIILVIGLIYSLENLSKNRFYLFVSIFLLYGLIQTASITSIFSFFITIIYLSMDKGRKYLKYFLPLIIISILFVSLIPITKNKILDNINILFHQNTKITDSILVRISIWEDTLKISIQSNKNFLIGVGPDNFSLKYEHFRGNNINTTSEWDSLIDKSHNYFLDIFVEQGIFGLIILIYILFLFFKKDNKEKIYLIPIIIYLFFNWPHIYLYLIFILILSKEFNIEIEVKKNIYIKIIIILFILSVLISLLIFRFEEQDENKNFYRSRNPYIKIQGIEYYQNKKELPNYLEYLKKEYPNNLKIWYEIYKSERFNNFKSSEKTKNKIYELRSDLIEWNEVFK